MAKEKIRIVSYITLFIVILLAVILGLFIYNKLTPHTLMLPAHNDVDYVKTNGDVCVKSVIPSNSTGSSMYPSVSSGNVLLLQKYDNNTLLKEGQIIVFNTENDGLVAHRVISAYNDFCFTKGDNSVNIEKVSNSNIRYLIVGIIFK